ncbi:hypothetical protein HDA35_004488 [Micromonospora purpureochromogenes]|uniref:Uncharacterized protein n=1 Tax=Micromonospora purpureochromogenes TaxID=47872 RepID=A0ABX2RQ52_9ACTN|nr:hypothetical protein [Micromonospora purpureochromogenes]
MITHVFGTRPFTFGYPQTRAASWENDGWAPHAGRRPGPSADAAREVSCRIR